MKGQILSRIQSFQTIRGKSNSNTHQNNKSSLRQVINPAKINKYIETNDQSIRQTRIQAEGPSNYTCSTKKVSKKLNPLLTESKSLKRIFHSGSHFHRSKRNIAKQTMDSLKQTLTYDRKQMTEMHQGINSKKLSFKQTNLKELNEMKSHRNNSNIENAPENQNYKYRLQVLKKQDRKEQICSSKDLGEYRINCKKDLKKIFNARGLYTRIPTSHQTLDRQSETFKSHKCIKLEKLSPSYSKLQTVQLNNDQKIGRYQNEQNQRSKNRFNKLTKTTAVFLKQKKNVPYFDMSSKRNKNNYPIETHKSQTCKNIELDRMANEQSHKKIPQNKIQIHIRRQHYNGKKAKTAFADENQQTDENQNLYSVINEINEDKEEVSIQLNQSIQRQQQSNELPEEQTKNVLSLNVSQIEEQQLNNDSSFLDESQKRMLNCIESSENKQKKKKSNTNKKYWGQLPDDFMKN